MPIKTAAKSPQELGTGDGDWHGGGDDKTAEQ